LTTSTLTISNDATVRTARLSNSGLLSKLCSDHVGIILVDTSSKQQILLLLDLGSVVHVLTWVGRLIFKNFDELVKARRND
jgi:hypothetical protein